jgi:bacteriocin-like protein
MGSNAEMTVPVEPSRRKTKMKTKELKQIYGGGKKPPDYRLARNQVEQLRSSFAASAKS